MNLDTEEAIKTLDTMSHHLDVIANREEHAHSEYGKYLEIMSFEMQKHANEIRELKKLFGGFDAII